MYIVAQLNLSGYYEFDVLAKTQDIDDLRGYGSIFCSMA